MERTIVPQTSRGFGKKKAMKEEIRQTFTLEALDRQEERVHKILEAKSNQDK